MIMLSAPPARGKTPPENAGATGPDPAAGTPGAAAASGASDASWRDPSEGVFPGIPRHSGCFEIEDRSLARR